jgi:hypothetical protein
VSSPKPVTARTVFKAVLEPIEFTIHWYNADDGGFEPQRRSAILFSKQPLTLSSSSSITLAQKDEGLYMLYVVEKVQVSLVSIALVDVKTKTAPKSKTEGLLSKFLILLRQPKGSGDGIAAPGLLLGCC